LLLCQDFLKGFDHIGRAMSLYGEPVDHISHDEVVELLKSRFELSACLVMISILSNG
jgi:hypothetical protein